MGCFITFAAAGNWSVLAISLVIGAFLGLACEYGGNWLYQAVTEKKECDTYMGENVLQEKKAFLFYVESSLPLRIKSGEEKPNRY